MEIKTALPSLWAVPDAIQTNLVAIEDAHPRCPRCTYFGELQQRDTSPYEWVSGQGLTPPSG